MSGVTAGLQVAGTAAVRRASSSCHGAGLGTAGQPAEGEEPAWTCLECGQPCERKPGEPEGMQFSG